MSLVALLATRIRVPPWLIELALAGLLVLGIWLSGVFHEKARIETRIVKQQVQVEKRVIETDHTHDQELSDLRAYRASHPVQPVRLCQPARVPIAAPRQPGAATGDLQPVSAGDSQLRPEPGPDISGMLELLSIRADEVSAGLRRRQELEP